MNDTINKPAQVQHSITGIMKSASSLEGLFEAKLSPQLQRTRSATICGLSDLTQKPIDLMRWCIGLVPNSRNVCDPFMGSGSTLRAGKDLGIPAIGIEIEEKYCEIAAKRLSQEVFNFDPQAVTR